MQPFPPQEATILFPGPVGALELLTTVPASAKQSSATAIICHPHPLHGGTMHNKVVTTLARACHHLGLRTIRFNFRGVGQSMGLHDGGRGESADVLAIA